MAVSEMDYMNVDGTDYTTRSMIAPIFDVFKAEKALSKGDLFIINDTLYKATADIAQNAQIVVGTNADLASTVSEELGTEIKAVTLTNDIAAGTVLASSSTWYSAAHTTLNKGIYIITATLAVSNDNQTGNLQTAINIGSTINSAKEISLDGWWFGQSQVNPCQQIKIPMAAVVEITSDGTNVIIAGYSNAGGVNRFGARSMQVVKLR